MRVTSLLDHRLAPAHQLAMAYHQLWEIENGFAELKNRLRGAGFILRSKAPELICQEIYALLTVYQALCAPRTRAAEHGGIDPDRRRLRLGRRRWPPYRTGPPARRPRRPGPS
jgi:hypothetical protein